MPRYMILEGKEGVLVPDERGRGRYVGQRLKKSSDGSAYFKDKYEPCRVAKEFGLTWIKMVKKGKLFCYGICIADDVSSALNVPVNKLRKLNIDGTVVREKGSQDIISDIVDITSIEGAE